MYCLSANFDILYFDSMSSRWEKLFLAWRSNNLSHKAIEILLYVQRERLPISDCGKDDFNSNDALDESNHAR
jgi:hypothetical protein